MKRTHGGCRGSSRGKNCVRTHEKWEHKWKVGSFSKEIYSLELRFGIVEFEQRTLNPTWKNRVANLMMDGKGNQH
jgi:hypothetical protein